METKDLKYIVKSQCIQHSQRGFAMVIALIIMTVMFVVVASLSASRQMWGFFSTKQLDKANIEFATRADSENWFRLNREALLRGPLSNSIYLASNAISTVTYIQQEGQEPFMAVITNSTGDPDYPTYGTNSFSLDIPLTYSGTNSLTNSSNGAFDPYWGLNGYGGSYSVMFKREMPEDVRQLREGRFDTNTTQMRAWMSVDAALIADVKYKVMPMSGFTYYFVSSMGTAPYTVPITTNFISVNNSGFSLGGKTVTSVGMGRIYVDGKADFLGASNQLVLGLPLVATKGYTNLGTSTIYFPSGVEGYGGGSVTTNLTYSNYYPHRYIRYKGMILNSSDTPQMLLTRFATESTNSTNYGFYSKTFSLGVLDWYASRMLAGVYCQLDTSTTTNPIVMYAWDTNRFTTNQANLFTSTNNAWSINHVKKEVTFSPPGNFFTLFSPYPPNSIYFRFTGANASQYKLRINVPSVSSLGSTIEQQKLSVITPATVVVSTNGFNTNNSGNGSMILSPRIEVDSTNAVNIGAYIVTQGVTNDILKPLFAYSPPTTPTNVTHNIYGGLSFTLVSGTGTNDSRPVRIIPDVALIKGEKLPPSVPAVFDLRISEKDIDVYDMTAVP